jgi:hypothetical protein
MKKIISLAAMLGVFYSCSKTVVVHSVSGNSPASQILVDKKSNSVISASNDQKGILINIRIPDSYDQYKILKYGGFLAINLPNNQKKSYVIAYPVTNQNNNLRIPIQTRMEEQLPMDSLLVNLSSEAGTMKIFNFYDQNVLTLPANKKDSVGVEVYHEPGEKGSLIYTAYIPFNSISDLKSNELDKTKIRISFSSGALKVSRFYGGGPAFAPSFSYSVPRTKEQRKNNIHPPTPDPKIVEKLAEPVSFDADLSLAVN